MNPKEALIAIKSLDLLFYNYTTSDMGFMLSVREFDHQFFEEGGNPANGASSELLWKVFTSIGYQSQTDITNYALGKYQAEALRGYQSEMVMSSIFKNAPQIEARS